MSDEIERLRQHLRSLEVENAQLRAESLAARERLTKQVAAHEQRYQMLFDSIDEGFCVIEFFDGPHGPLSDYIHIEANAAYARHTGIPNVVGQKVREMVPGEADGWVALYREVLLTGHPIRFERELVATSRFLELAAFRIEPPELRQVAVLFQDITARKSAELSLKQLNDTLETRIAEAVTEREAAMEALRQSQKMEAVGQLTGGIAHDFNNMLAVILASLRLSERKLSRGDHDIQTYITSAMQGAERAANLVSRLLAYARQQPLSPQRLDANELLSDMAVVLERTIPESIAVDLVRGDDLWPLEADPHGLENAIVNLAVNARDAMPDGGRLTIETANAELDAAYAAANAEVSAGDYVLVAVSDSGHGMTRDVVARAFEPFFTTKVVGAGTGLGLSQVYGFLKQSGGHVKIYSEPGVGTSVKMYFPRARRAVVAAAGVPCANGTELPDGNGRLVLVVEDDDDVRRLSVDMLSELGFKVISADGPKAALALVDAHPGIELMITDVVMPGMNGRKLAEQVLAARPGIRVLFTTGYTRNAMVNNGMLDDMGELLMKPYTLEAMGAKLARILG